MTHKWVETRVGHGIKQCEYCHVTMMEAAALGEANAPCPQAPATTKAVMKEITPEAQAAEERMCTCGAGHGSLEGHTNWCAWVLAALTSPAPAGGEADEAYMLVPKEPTPAMLKAGDEAILADSTEYVTLEIYRAMLAAFRRSGGKQRRKHR